MTVVEMYDASSPLTPPDAVDQGEYINQLREGSGLLLNGIDHLFQRFFGYSLLGKIVEPFTGDWAQLQAAQQGWLRMGSALNATADNWDAGSNQVGNVWEGAAAQAATLRMAGVAESHRVQAQGCATLADQLGRIIDVAKSAGELVATGLSVINEIVMHLAAEAAAVVVGWIAAAVDIPRMAIKVAMWSQKMFEAIQKVVDVIGIVMKVVAILQKAMQFIATSYDVDSGQLMDDTSRVQFMGA